MDIISKYKPLFEKPDNIRYVLISGGRGSGKSHTASQYILKRLYGNEYTRGAFMRQTYGTIEASIYQEILDRIHDESLQNKIKITKKPYSFRYRKNSFVGLSFKASSGSQTAKLKSISGFNIIVIEEAEEIEEEDFKKLTDSLRKVGVDITIVLLFNPPHAYHWINERFFDLTPHPDNNEYFLATLKKIHKKSALYIHTTYEDNKQHIHAQTILEYEQYKEKDPSHYWHMIKGLVPAVKTGLIFTDYSVCTEEEYAFIDSTEYFGMDFGSNDPTTLQGVKINEENKKIYIKGYFYESKLTQSRIEEYLDAHNIKGKIACDSASKQMVEGLKEKGYPVYSINKKPGSILTGIQKLQSYHLVVCDTNHGLLGEIKEYSWKQNKDKKNEDAPIDKFNHAFDAVRYAILDVSEPYTPYFTKMRTKIRSRLTF